MTLCLLTLIISISKESLRIFQTTCGKGFLIMRCWIWQQKAPRLPVPRCASWVALPSRGVAPSTTTRSRPVVSWTARPGVMTKLLWTLCGTTASQNITITALAKKVPWNGSHMPCWVAGWGNSRLCQLSCVIFDVSLYLMYPWNYQNGVVSVYEKQSEH